MPIIGQFSREGPQNSEAVPARKALRILRAFHVNMPIIGQFSREGSQNSEWLRRRLSPSMQTKPSRSGLSCRDPTRMSMAYLFIIMARIYAV
jgi:hypothetical protein